jgi:hypothetical protein
MIVVLFLLSLIGIAILSVALSIVITHFILMGIEALLPLRHIVHYQTTNDNECERDPTNNPATAESKPTYPLTIRHYDLYDIIRSHITKMPKNRTRNQCLNHKDDTNEEEYHRYINRYPPCVTQHPLPFPPIKHIRTIVNKLRRRVNHSGTEPPGRHTSQAHSMAGEADFLKTRLIALYYSMIDMATRV